MASVGEFWVRMYFVGYFVDRFEEFRFKNYVWLDMIEKLRLTTFENYQNFWAICINFSASTDLASSINAHPKDTHLPNLHTRHGQFEFTGDITRPF